MTATRSGRSTLELIRSSAIGDQRAITDLVVETSPEFLEFVARRTSNDPELLVNEVLASVLRKLPELEISSANEFRAYVYRSLRNRLADEARKQRLNLVPLDQAPEWSTATGTHEHHVDTRMSLDGWLSVLTPDQRAVISSRFIHDLSLEETARVVGKPVPAVKSLQSRALRSLRLLAGAAACLAVLGAGVLLYQVSERERLQPLTSDLSPSIPDRADGVNDGTGDLDGVGPAVPPVEPPPAEPAPVAADDTAGEAGLQAEIAPTDDRHGSSTSTPSTTIPSASGAPPAGQGSPGGPVAGGPSVHQDGSTGTPTTQAAPAGSSPAVVTTAGPVETPVPQCVALEGAGSVHEGSVASYRLVFDRASDVDRTHTLSVVPGSAGWVGPQQGLEHQDIMWGGQYTQWTWSVLLGWTQDGTIVNRVPDGNGLLATTKTDRPMVGPADATWDYSLVVDGVIQHKASVVVVVPAGQTRSSVVEVRAWRETITVDRKGPDAGHAEIGESFGLSGAGCSLTVNVTDTSIYHYVNGSF